MMFKCSSNQSDESLRVFFCSHLNRVAPFVFDALLNPTNEYTESFLIRPIFILAGSR